MSTHNNNTSNNTNGVEVFLAPTINNTHNTGDNNMYGNGEAYTPIQHEETVTMTKSDQQHLLDKIASIESIQENLRVRLDNMRRTYCEAMEAVRSLLAEMHDGGTDLSEYKDQIEELCSAYGMKPLTKRLSINVTYDVTVSGTIDIPIWVDEQDLDVDDIDVEVRLGGDLLEDNDHDVDAEVGDGEVTEWDCD